MLILKKYKFIFFKGKAFDFMLIYMHPKGEERVAAQRRGSGCTITPICLGCMTTFNLLRY